VLGQPLDYAVQVRLDPGEALSAECVLAEVMSGDRRVPPPLVRTVVEMTGPESARVRVLTQPSIDEPVVSVQVSVGCSSKISRRYVVLADPPINAPASPSSVAPAFAATPAPAEALSAPAPATATPPSAAAQTSAGEATAAPLAGDGTMSGQAAPAAQNKPKAKGDRRVAAGAPRQPKVPRAAPEPAPVARLKLDPAEAAVRKTEAMAVEQALAAVEQAASAARSAASAASASAERVAVLERTVEQLRAEAKSSGEQAAQLRTRLQAAEGAGNWTWPLLGLAGALSALAAWLAWRLGRANTARQQGWHAAAAEPRTAVPTMQPMTEQLASRPATAPVPFVTSGAAPATPAAPVAISRPKAAPAWPPPAPAVAWPPPATSILPHEPTEPVDTGMMRTLPLPPQALPDAGAARDVTIEELIDLEQQAEFFIVLGQDESAIDLLVEHLRSTGGGSPLPYLKLLEIHRRRDDHEAYERMRSRFNHRFNAYAPEWGVDLTHGRALDDYPGVIPRLQQVWSRPLDAMAELEALLFRKSRGELFDLPAYREVLFLYSLARDLLDRSSADSGNVDLLLPMSDGTEFGSTSPAPYLGLERDAFKDTQAPEDLPTAPVDFDLTSTDRRTSIFDLLDDRPQPSVPPRRN
jgi:hypothetical protein